MFVKVTQSGPRRYAQLVESFRNEQGKPRQRTICTLGRLRRWQPRAPGHPRLPALVNDGS